MADRPYVRVYHADLIRDYPEIWDDDAALAAWLRLLVAADGSWPAPAELPRSVKDRVLSVLISKGLVIRVGQHRFSIRGLDTERIGRHDAARNAAASRWGNATGNADRIATGNAKTMPNRAEPSKAEPSSNAGASDDPWDAPEMPALQWLAQHGCDIRPGNGFHQKLVTAVEVHGADSLVEMFERLAAAGTRHGDVKGFLFGAIDALNAKTRPNLTALQSVDAEERAAERSDQIRERMIARRLDWYRNSGQWDPEWGPKPETVQ